MKITYDKNLDAAYIEFETNESKSVVSMTYACDPIEVNGQIQLDFDAN